MTFLFRTQKKAKPRKSELKLHCSLLRVLERALVVGVLICVFSLRSGIAQNTVLSLDDFIRLATAAQSTLTVAQRDADIARYGLIQARNNFLPQTRFNNAYVYNSPQIGNPQNFSFVQANGIREYLSQFAAGMELDTSGRLRAGLARAKADRDAAEANLAIAGRAATRNRLRGNGYG